MSLDKNSKCRPDDTLEFTRADNNDATATIIDGVIGLTIGIAFKFAFRKDR